MNLTLHIPKILLDLRIGYFDYEREFKKKNAIEIILKYKTLPMSCINDSLEDRKTDISYKDIVESLQIFTQNKSYHTIEKWCYEISQFLIKHFELQNIFSYFHLKFTKIIIPLHEITDGVNCIFEKTFD
jgi:FolB domain-containing protein